jgi:hypothetical protein
MFATEHIKRDDTDTATPWKSLGVYRKMEQRGNKTLSCLLV